MNNPIAYILCYTIRTKKGKLKDKWEIFCEYDQGGNSCHVQAFKRVDELFRSKKELYSWNVAKLVATSEHYTTE